MTLFLPLKKDDKISFYCLCVFFVVFCFFYIPKRKYLFFWKKNNKCWLAQSGKNLLKLLKLGRITRDRFIVKSAGQLHKNLQQFFWVPVTSSLFYVMVFWTQICLWIMTFHVSSYESNKQHQNSHFPPSFISISIPFFLLDSE